jgi:hypothetical protein
MIRMPGKAIPDWAPRTLAQAQRRATEGRMAQTEELGTSMVLPHFCRVKTRCKTTVAILLGFWWFGMNVFKFALKQKTYFGPETSFCDAQPD